MSNKKNGLEENDLSPAALELANAHHPDDDAIVEEPWRDDPPPEELAGPYESEGVMRGRSCASETPTSEEFQMRRESLGKLTEYLNKQVEERSGAYDEGDDGIMESWNRVARLCAPFDAFLQEEPFSIKAGIVIPTDEASAEDGIYIDLGDDDSPRWSVLTPPGGENLIYEITAVNEDGKPMAVEICMRREGIRFVARFDFNLVAKKSDAML